MTIAKMTSKGQITLPREIRDRLGLEMGDRVDFVIRDSGEVVLEPATVEISSLRGSLKRKNQKKVTIEQMQDAIERGAATR